MTLNGRSVQDWVSAGQRFLTEMANVDVAPMVMEVLRNETPMTMVRFILAAKQTTFGYGFFSNLVFDMAFTHKTEKLPLVLVPVPMFLSVSSKHLLRRR